MTAVSINPPYPIFSDVDGKPLDNGYIYVGVVDQNPEVSPTAVYWDSELTIPAAQPIRTSGGYPARNGTPSRIYASSDYSITVRNKNGLFIYSAPVSTIYLNSERVSASDGAGGSLWTTVQGFIDYTISSVGSSTIGFIQASIGAVKRTVQDKLRETISVKDFGAKGDDATDDVAAFQAAASYIASSTKGVNLYVPAGTYRLSNTVTFPNSKSFTIHGDGDASCIRLIAGSGGPILTIGSASIYPTRQVVKDLFFQGPVSGTTNGLLMRNCNTARIESCVFQSQVTGIELHACYAVELISNVFDVCTAYGVISPTASCHNLIVKRNNFFTCGIGAGGHAIHLAVASDNISIEDNDFEYCNVALRMNNCTAVSFRGNYAEYCASSIFDFIGTNRGIVIDENWLALGTLSATIANVSGGSLKNNTIYNQTIGVAASCLDFVVGRNYKHGTGSLATSSWATPTLSGTFAAQSGYYLAQYIKQENNQVQLRGNLLLGANNSLIFNLPVGYRPSNTCTFATASSAAPGVSIVEVRANGDVWCISRDAAQGTGLNGISFEALN